jgi:hypothetical protein
LDGKKIGITWRLKESLQDMKHADDVCLQSRRYEHMQRKLYDLWEKYKKVGFEVNLSKTEEIRVNAVVNQGLGLNGDNIKRSSDFYYLGSVVAEESGASTEGNVRIQKVGGSFCRLSKVWLSA